MTPSPTDLAWAAGIIDGEGCIAITRVKHVNTPRLQYAVYVAVGNTDPRMPQRMRSLFGGNVLIKHSRPKARTMFEWRIFSSNVGRVLKQLRPYLVVKGEQAEVALAFVETLQLTGRKGHSEEMLVHRELMRSRIAVLKREEVS